ncbi:MAG: RsmD family RNA methyltransferase, partial [Desulfovibrionaceae bacterium]|nr:RsmD family RNA methyltransferase [Desulfovibrionaceae bacterium]
MFVENNPKVAAVIQKTAADLGLEPGQFRVNTDPVARALGKSPARRYGLVFIDPPYAENIVPGAVKLLLKNGWLEPGALIAAEVEAKPQTGKPLNAEGLSPELEVLADRAYGQTRLVLWEYVCAE